MLIDCRTHVNMLIRAFPFDRHVKPPDMSILDILGYSCEDELDAPQPQRRMQSVWPGIYCTVITTERVPPFIIQVKV